VLFAAPAAAPPRSFAASTALPAAFFKSEPLLFDSFLFRVAAAFLAALLRSAFVRLVTMDPFYFSELSSASLRRRLELAERDRSRAKPK
jgi:hypothetical protein